MENKKLFISLNLPDDNYTKQEKLFSRKRTIRVTHRSQNIENSWAFLSFKVDMTFTLNDIDLQMTLTFK